MEGRGRQRQAEPAMQSQAGKRDTEPPAKKKEKELNKESRGGERAPQKSQECVQESRHSCSVPLHLKPVETPSGRAVLGGASRDTGTGSSSVTNSRQVTTLFASGFAPGEARGLDDDLRGPCQPKSL